VGTDDVEIEATLDQPVTEAAGVVAGIVLDDECARSVRGGHPLHVSRLPDAELVTLRVLHHDPAFAHP
jgi:hypothetical protein